MDRIVAPAMRLASRFPRVPWTVALFASAVTLGSVPSSARAGGAEATVVGARALGRGGAMTSSAVGFDALRYNPARLAVAEQWTIGADMQLHATSVCFDRVDDAYGTAYPRVCNSSGVGVVPQIGASIPIGDRVGIGFGVLPPGGTPALQFGNTTDGTIGVDGQRVASPSRYSNVLTDNFAAWVTAGIGVEVHPKLRLGANFGAGLIRVESISFTAAVPGSGPTNDTRTALGAVDRFVPRISLGIDYEPVPGLSISSLTTWTDDLRADASLFLSGENGGGFSTEVQNVRVTQAFGWEQTLGVRYARDRWDVEANVMLQAHARTDRITVDIPDDATIPVSSTINGQALSELPDARYVERRWKNQLVLRLGGEGEIIEDRLSLRGGFSYESNGLDTRYTSVENFLVRRAGLHFGLGVKVHRAVELNVAFAHIFQPTTTVALADARVPQPVASEPGGLAGQTIYVNGGTYRGNIDVLAFSILVRPDPVQEPAR